MEACKSLIARLTSRESEIANQIVHGSSNKEIARALDISPRTVEVHRANIFKKLEGRMRVRGAGVSYSECTRLSGDGVPMLETRRQGTLEIADAT